MSQQVAALVVAWAQRRDTPDHPPWQCVFARSTAAGELLGYVDADSCSAVRVDVGPAGTRISDVADDPALPGLAEVRARLTGSRIVRYRPGKRCTLHGRSAGRDSFVKVAPDGERHQRSGRALWMAAGSGALPIAVAEPLGWDEATESSWWGVVPGHPVGPALLGPAGAQLAFAMGSALGALARAPIRPEADLPPATQLARTARAVERAGRLLPELGSGLTAAYAALAEAHQALPPRPLVPVHGAPHMHQWLDDGHRLGLVDFDRFGRGEPELDAATLLVELAFEPGRAVSLDTLTAAVCAGYAAAGVPLDPHRLTLSRAHKHLAKVARTAQAPHPDRAARADRQLATVTRLLSGTGLSGTVRRRGSATASRPA